MSFPRAPARLPDEMAQALGHAISGFGFLEETLKRCIYALSRHRLGKAPDEDALEDWLERMEDVADDSMGTLIEQFIHQLKKSPFDDPELDDRLDKIRSERNLLCHASWKPGRQDGRWQPAFLNTRGRAYPRELGPDDLTEIHARSLETAARIVAIMRQTGIRGAWIGMEEDD